MKQGHLAAKKKINQKGTQLSQDVIPFFAPKMNECAWFLSFQLPVAATLQKNMPMSFCQSCIWLPIVRTMHVWLKNREKSMKITKFFLHDLFREPCQQQRSGTFLYKEDDWKYLKKNDFSIHIKRCRNNCQKWNDIVKKQKSFPYRDFRKWNLKCQNCTLMRKSVSFVKDQYVLLS